MCVVASVGVVDYVVVDNDVVVDVVNAVVDVVVVAQVVDAVSADADVRCCCWCGW